MQRLKHTCAILFFLLSSAAIAAPVTVTYDFSATNFMDGIFDGTPSPVETVEGSFGFTFAPGTGAATISADSVSLSILGFDYTIENTIVEVLGGTVDSTAIGFGGALNGANITSPFTNDFSFVFFVDSEGKVLPELTGSLIFRTESLFDGWLSVPPDFLIALRENEPDALLDLLGAAVSGVGPGKSLGNKIMLAQTYLAVPDVQSACAVLNSFLNQVRAQRGKKLTIEQFDEFTSDAEVIIEAIGCD